MNKNDFARRLKRLVYNECEITKGESEIAQKSAKFYEQMSSIKTMLAKQEQDLSKYRKEVDELNREINILEKYKQREEDKLCALTEKLQQMKSLYLQKQEQQIEQRQIALLQMDCIRNIKLATQSYINLNALPKLIQGVTNYEKDSSSEWKPFCIDPSKHTRKEIEDMLWSDPQTNSVFKKTWESLIYDEILRDASKIEEVETESGNVNMFVQQLE